MRVVDWKTLLQVKKISFNSLRGSFMQLTVKCITFTIKELIDMKSAHWTQEVCNCFLSSQRAFESLKNLSCDFMTQNWLTKLHKNFNAIFLLLIISFYFLTLPFDLTSFCLLETCSHFFMKQLDDTMRTIFWENISLIPFVIINLRLFRALGWFWLIKIDNAVV